MAPPTGRILFESGNGSSSALTKSNANVFEFDRWNYLAVTVNRTTGVVRLYNNGTDVTAVSGVHQKFNTNAPLRLGIMSNNVFAMMGQLDDIRVYQRVLSSSEIVAAMNGTSMAGPSSLSAGAVTWESADLSWKDNTGQEEGYQVERSLSSGSGFSRVATLGAGTISYHDGGLSESTTYYYRVRAFNSTENSAWSNTLTVHTSAIPQPVDDMLAYWPLDGNGKDLTGHGYNLTLYNGATYSSDHLQGTASGTFDGTNDFSSSPVIDPGNTFTLAMWVRIPSGRSNIQTIMANGPSGSSSDGFKVLVNTYATTDRKISFESGDGSTSAITRSNTGAFAFDTWNHLAVTVNRNTGVVGLYLNGSDITAEHGAHTRFKTSGALRLARMTNNLFEMSGQLDDVRVYNRVLSPSEIQSVIQQSVPGIIKGAVNTESMPGAGDIQPISPDEQAGLVAQPDFTVYPNPFINTLSISNAGDIDRVELIDLSGKVLRNVKVNGESVCTFDTGDLPSGVYLVKITGKNNFLKIQKVIRY